MKGILDTLIRNSQKSIDAGVYNNALKLTEPLQKSQKNLEEEIRQSKDVSLITEIKFSSPSRGKIRKKSDPLEIAEKMRRGGARALSILTQPRRFDGSPDYFIKIRQNIDIPLLMKDIIIDKKQIDAAEKMGADYFLLIQALFEPADNRKTDETRHQFIKNNVNELIEYGHNKGLKILLEAHTKTEFENAIHTKADIIGINNRNLDTLKVSRETTKSLLQNYSGKKIIVSESGINSEKDIKFLRDCGADAFLIGTSIMKSSDIENKVSNLVNAT